MFLPTSKAAAPAAISRRWGSVSVSVRFHWIAIILCSNRCVGETVSASWKQWANSTSACACVKSSIEHCQPPVEFSAGSLTCGWLSPNLLVERDKILHCLTATGCRLQAFRARSIFANTTYDTLIYFDNSQNTWTLKLKAVKDVCGTCYTLVG